MNFSHSLRWERPHRSAPELLLKIMTKKCRILDWTWRCEIFWVDMDWRNTDKLCALEFRLSLNSGKFCNEFVSVILFCKISFIMKTFNGCYWQMISSAIIIIYLYPFNLRQPTAKFKLDEVLADFLSNTVRVHTGIKYCFRVNDLAYTCFKLQKRI